VRTRNRTSGRGYTLLELVVTVCIIGILAALAAIGMNRYKPRAGLANTAAEVTALLNYARQNAQSSGNDTIVMFFTGFANPSGGIGRVIVYEDPNFNFFNAASAINFGGYNPAAPAIPAAPASSSFETLDLPRVTTFGYNVVAVGPLPAPYGPTIAPALASPCSFCAGGRGAVLFDARGRARFYNANGAPLAIAGGTLAFTSNAIGWSSQIEGYRILVITPAAGAVKTFNRG